jgi:hypothetical protein
MITKQIIEKGISYEEYFKITENLVLENKTSGKEQSEFLSNYTRLNFQRMKRVEKTSEILPELQQLITQVPKKWVWLVLTESWCGDAAQNLPIIAKIAQLSPNISLKILWRDENSDIMNLYLTNGGKSIPKLICVEDDCLCEVGTWGPRPQILQDWFEQEKASPTMSKEDMMEYVHSWYAKDKTLSLQAEFMEFLPRWFED